MTLGVDKPSNTVVVWDLPIRLFHWLVVIDFVFLVVTGNIGGDWIIWHIRAAYIMSGLVLFRILWGVLGSYHARFHHFVTSPIKVLQYLTALVKGKAPAYYGHNPAGAVMVIILLFALLVQFLAGTVITDDIMWYGPFYGWVTESLASLGTRIHHQMEIILLVLVGIHILAVLFHQLRLKEKLIQGMVHGKKMTTPTPPQTVSVNYLSLTLSIIVASIWVWWLWSLPV